MATSSETFDVFISYSSKDKTRVHEFAQALKSAGAVVWLDDEQIDLGDVIAAKIDSGLNDSRAVAIMLSGHALSSNWVHEELNGAIHKAVNGGKHLLPVELEPVDRTKVPFVLNSRRSVILHDHDAGVWEAAISKLSTLLIKWRRPTAPVEATTLPSGPEKASPPETIPPQRSRPTGRGHSAGINGCDLATDSSVILTASDDRTLIVWSKAGEQLRRLVGHTGLVLGCKLTRDGRTAASVSHDRTARIWDVQTGELKKTLVGHLGVVWRCDFTSDGERLLTASYDRRLIVWDVASGKQQLRFDGSGSAIWACAITPDDKRAVSGSQDGTLRIWSMTDGRELVRIKAHDGPIYDCCISPDGMRIVTAGADHTVRVWQQMNAEEWLRLTGHTAAVKACDIASDNSTVVTASEDNTLRVWNSNTGQCLTIVEGQRPFNAVAVSSSIIVAGSQGRRLWKVPLPKTSKPSLATSSGA